MTPIRVLVADDQALFRKGVANLLAAEADFEVVGEAVDGREALEMSRRLHPDVVLMDVSMPRMDGLEATRLIRAEMPRVQVVVITVLDSLRTRAEAERCGAHDCLAKRVEPQQLYGALRHAHEATPAA